MLLKRVNPADAPRALYLLTSQRSPLLSDPHLIKIAPVPVGTECREGQSGGHSDNHQAPNPSSLAATSKGRQVTIWRQQGEGAGWNASWQRPSSRSRRRWESLGRPGLEVGLPDLLGIMSEGRLAAVARNSHPVSRCERGRASSTKAHSWGGSASGQPRGSGACAPRACEVTPAT